MKRKWLGIAIVVCVLSVPVILKFTNAAPLKVVEIEKVAPHEIKASILASGNLAYQEEARLSPEVIGKVTEILVKEGDHVDAGQIVLLLDEKTYRAEIAQQEAAVRQQRLNIEHQQVSLENQELQFERKKDLLQRKYITEPQFDEVRYAVELARIDLRTSREGLQQAEAVLKQSSERSAKTKIRAPISGTVTAIDIKIGETAVASQVGIAGSSLMTIANTNTIITEVNVDEADIARVKIGQEVAIHTAAYPDVPLSGRVKVIPLSPKRNDGTGAQGGSSSLARNYSLKVSVENPTGLLLRPGMTCRAEIFTSTTGHALAVPIQSILGNDNEKTETPATNGNGKKPGPAVKIGNYVFVNHDGVAEKRIVKAGISDDTYQEILHGLVVGDVVITGPYKMLRHLTAGEHIKLSEAGISTAGSTAR